MHSSTSPSERRLPRIVIGLLLTAGLVWTLCALYSTRWDAEVRFYTALSRIQDAWVRKLGNTHANKIVFYGGSSCTFSIDGDYLFVNHNLPVVNRGLAAGMGIKIPTLNALKDLKPGDTLVIALEPGQLTSPAELTSLALHFCFAVNHPEWARDRTLQLPACGHISAWLALRPGCQHLVVMTGKLLQGRPLYRYDVEHARPSGFVATDVRNPISGPPGHGDRLSADVVNFLPALRQWCDTNGVRVAYSLPWGYCPPDQAAAFRRQNAATLLRLSAFVPVLKDPQLGADTNATHFADTVWHLTASAARLRTEALAPALKHWDLWSADELRQAAGAPESSAPPSTANGSSNAR